MSDLTQNLSPEARLGPQGVETFPPRTGQDAGADTQAFSRFDRFSRPKAQNKTAGLAALLMPAEAMHGIVGDIVRAIEPHSEADPSAVLIQILVAAGNLLGRSAHFVVEADKHYANLFAVIVGVSSKGRKGSSWGHVRRIMSQVDEGWATDRVQGGLASGEGLIWAVRDPISERQPIRSKGRVEDYQWVETDPGVGDKRLLIVEPEYGRVLQVCERETCTLSAVIRQAFDTGSIRILTKKQSAVATDAHISVIGHITKDELLRLLTDTMTANGYGNRFLWCSVQRSKLLPEGGDFQQVDIQPFVERLRAVAQFARDVGEVRRSDAAAQLWAHVYPELSAERAGMIGALTARAEALAMRIALLYAVLDQSTRINAEHLAAGLAVWRYCQQSTERIFGDATGDPEADTILTNLRQRPEGMSRSEIVNLFSRHRSKSQIDRALTALEGVGLASQSQAETGGRPLTVWAATLKMEDS